MFKNKLIGLLTVLTLAFLSVCPNAFAQNAELLVTSVFNKQISNVNKKAKTVNDNIVTLKLNNYDKSQIMFYLPEHADLVSVFTDNVPVEKPKSGITFVEVPVTNRTKEVTVTTRQIIDPVYIANNITASDIKSRMGTFTLDLPMPDMTISSSSWSIYGEDNIIFTKSSLVEKIVSAINYITTAYENNSEKIKEYGKNKYVLIGLGIGGLILFALFFGYIRRLYKMVAWFLVWPRKRIKPAGFVVLFLMFSGVIGYFVNLWVSFVPNMPNEISDSAEACSIIRSSILNTLNSSKDATTNNIQELIDKGVLKGAVSCPSFGFYNYDGTRVTCTAHGGNKGLLYYQIKMPATGKATVVSLPEIKNPNSSLIQNFYYADKALAYGVFAIIFIVFFFFVFIPVFLAKKLDASYDKLFKKKAPVQQQGGFNGMNMRF